MYTYNKKILFSDIDGNSRMTLDGMMDSMQDCININSESIGRGISYMSKTKRAWFAISWTIWIKRLPKLFEEVVVKTWPYGFSASIGQRNVIITDEAGNDIVYADSMWALMDMEAGRPTKILEEDQKGYDLEEKYPIEDNPGRKIKLPVDLQDMDIFTVKKSAIDFNGHMSNGVYIEAAYEYLPLDIEVKRIRVEYKNQSRYEERLKIKTAKEDDRYVIVFYNEAGNETKAVVEFLV